MDKMLKAGRRQHLLLLIAVIFHAVGLTGIGILHSDTIAASTPLHLILMGLLTLISFSDQLKPFLIWAAITAMVSFWAEWLGVHTGWLFGSYRYGAVLGTRAFDIPLLIGMNWVVVVAGACSIAGRYFRSGWISIPVAACLAAGYDFILEPVAIKLSYWRWLTPEIPPFNYICWFAFAGLFAVIWNKLQLRGNIFAAGLFVLQLIFFILLRVLL
jgi:putative membrane protein